MTFSPIGLHPLLNQSQTSSTPSLSHSIHISGRHLSQKSSTRFSHQENMHASMHLGEWAEIRLTLGPQEPDWNPSSLHANMLVCV